MSAAPDDACLQCGEGRGTIRALKLFCATTDYWGEVIQEWDRHRFRPWTAKELEQQEREEEAMNAYYQGFADFMQDNPDAGEEDPP